MLGSRGSKKRNEPYTMLHKAQKNSSLNFCKDSSIDRVISDPKLDEY